MHPALCASERAACLRQDAEIDHYAEYSEAQDLPIAFHDLNDATLLRDWNLTEDMAARRLHVLKKGMLMAGIPAFIALWQEMPRYRWLARLVSLPGVFRLSCWSYDYVLAPLIYRWHLRRKARQRKPS